VWFSTLKRHVAFSLAGLFPSYTSERDNLGQFDAVRKLHFLEEKERAGIKNWKLRKP
jgi:hypothetical protein